MPEHSLQNQIELETVPTITPTIRVENLYKTDEPDISRFARCVVLFRDGSVQRDTPIEELSCAAQILAAVPRAGEEDEAAEKSEQGG
jgi:hypothetical protein